MSWPIRGQYLGQINLRARGRGVILEAVSGAHIPELNVGVDGAAAVTGHVVSCFVEGAVPTSLNMIRWQMRKHEDTLTESDAG